MSDLIKREAVIETLTKWFADGDILKGDMPNCNKNYRKAKYLLETIPSAEPSVGYVGVDDDYLVSVKEVLNITAETGALETQRRVKELPRRDRAQGKWIDLQTFDEWYGHAYQCSVCGRDGLNWDFCPNCGARMRKGADDE